MFGRTAKSRQAGTFKNDLAGKPAGDQRHVNRVPRARTARRVPRDRARAMPCRREGRRAWRDPPLNRPGRAGAPCRPAPATHGTSRTRRQPRRPRLAKPSSSTILAARSRSTESARSPGARAALRNPRPNRCPDTALSTASRLALTQTPRPGRRSARSGTISPEGASTNRTSADFSADLPVAMQRRRTLLF